MGDHVITFARETVAKALRGIYPIELDSLYALVLFGDKLRQVSTAVEVLSLLER